MCYVHKYNKLHKEIKQHLSVSLCPERINHVVFFSSKADPAMCTYKSTPLLIKPMMSGGDVQSSRRIKPCRHIGINKLNSEKQHPLSSYSPRPRWMKNESRVRGWRAMVYELMSQPESFKQGVCWSAQTDRILRECQNTNNGVGTCSHTRVQLCIKV